MFKKIDSHLQYSVGRFRLTSQSPSFTIILSDTYLFFWMEEGNVCLSINGEQIKVSQNSCILCNTNTNISFHSNENSTIRFFQFYLKKYSDNFTKSVLDSFFLLFDKIDLYKEVFLNNNHKTILKFYYNLLFKIQQCGISNLNVLSINNTIQHIISLVVALFEEKYFLFDKIRVNSYLSKFEDLVEKNIFKERNVCFYCDSLGLHYSSLNKLCFSAFGINVKKYLDSRCVFHIKCKLATSSLNTAEISDFFHFSDVSNFIRFFKRLTGMTIGQYRLILVGNN